jgi:hypothetical protein
LIDTFSQSPLYLDDTEDIDDEQKQKLVLSGKTHYICIHLQYLQDPFYSGKILYFVLYFSNQREVLDFMKVVREIYSLNVFYFQENLKRIIVENFPNTIFHREVINYQTYFSKNREENIFKIF